MLNSHACSSLVRPYIYTDACVGIYESIAVYLSTCLCVYPHIRCTYLKSLQSSLKVFLKLFETVSSVVSQQDALENFHV